MARGSGPRGKRPARAAALLLLLLALAARAAGAPAARPGPAGLRPAPGAGAGDVTAAAEAVVDPAAAPAAKAVCASCGPPCESCHTCEQKCRTVLGKRVCEPLAEVSLRCITVNCVAKSGVKCAGRAASEACSGAWPFCVPPTYAA